MAHFTDQWTPGGGGDAPAVPAPVAAPVPAPVTPQSLWEERPERERYGTDFNLTAPESIMGGFNQRLNVAQGDVDRMRGFATSTGDSPWATSQKQLLKSQQGIGREQIANQQASQVQGSLGALGSSGGYDSGSRERIQQGANRNAMMARQGLARTGQMAGAQIGGQDAAMKAQMMQNLPGMQQGLTSAWAGQKNLEGSNQMRADMLNSGIGIGDIDAQNQFDMNQWMQKGQLYGSDQMANAMANQGQGGGMLGGAGNLFNKISPMMWGANALNRNVPGFEESSLNPGNWF